MAEVASLQVLTIVYTSNEVHTKTTKIIPRNWIESNTTHDRWMFKSDAH